MCIKQNSTGIKITLKDIFTIQINNGDRDYYNSLKDYFSDYVPGYFYMPKYQAGIWDGKISLFNSLTRTLPYGLFIDFLKFHKKYYPNIELDIDESIKEKFIGVKNISWKWNLSLSPRYYQEDIIKKMLLYRSCIVESCTRSGKSLSISYIFQHLIDNNLAKKLLLVVPRVDLVRQFKKDMLSYNIDPNLIGVVWAEEKEFDKTITISTWQSLQFIEERFKNEFLGTNKLSIKQKKKQLKSFEDPFLVYDAITIDECHKSGSDGKLHYILQKCKNANWRFGLTGTLPDDKISLWNVKSYLGPVVCSYKTEELRKQGYVANCIINIIHTKYKKKDFSDEISKETIFKQPKRIELIKNIIKKASDKPIVLLVDSIKKDGEFLENVIKNDEEFKNREVIFIKGSVKSKEREIWYEKCRNGENVILIAMYQILQEGLTIPCLEYLIFASPCSSKIRVLQSIGRTLGIYYSKLNAKIYDIVDIAPEYKAGKKAGNIRQKHYLSQQFDIKEITI